MDTEEKTVEHIDIHHQREANVKTDAKETQKESRKSNRQRLKPKWMTSGEFQVNQIQTNQPDWKNRLDCLSSLANSNILDGIDKRELSKAMINIITLK